MATLARGQTFGATEQVTNTKLHNLVDSATLSNVAQTDIAAGEGLVHRGTSAPSDTDQLWVDTSLTPTILKLYDGTNWVPADEYNVLTNRAGQSMAAGHVTIVDTSNTESVKFTSTAGDLKWRGICIQSISNTSTGVIKTGGYVPSVLLEISASAGCFLRTSTATGKAEPVASGSAGIFAIVTTSGTASAGAFLFSSAFQVTSSASAASQAEMETATNTNNPVVPGRVQYHPGVAKAWCNFNGTGTPAMAASHNFDASITDNGTGDYTLSITTDFSSANWCFLGSAQDAGASNQAWVCINATDGMAAGTVRISVQSAAATLRDSAIVCIAAFGDQA